MQVNELNIEEKTPLEKIDEIYDMMHSLQRQMSVMDTNIKLLNSKVNGELFNSIKKFNFQEPPQLKQAINKSTNSNIIKDLDAPATIGVPVPDSIDAPKVVLPKESSPKRNTTIVQGKILDEDGRPLPGVNVKIISPANKDVIAETKTNNAGLWTKFLGPGKYIVKYVHDTRPTQFRMIDVAPGKEKLVVQ